MIFFSSETIFGHTYCDIIVWSNYMNIASICVTNNACLRASLWHHYQWLNDVYHAMWHNSAFIPALQHQTCMAFQEEPPACTTRPLHHFQGGRKDMSTNIPSVPLQVWSRNGVILYTGYYSLVKYIFFLSPALREESSQTNVILQYKLLAAILSAICCVIQQS